MPKQLVEVLYSDPFSGVVFSTNAIFFFDCFLMFDCLQECIKLGVRKFNVNTEVRKAYMDSLSNPKKDLIHAMGAAKEAMKAVVAEKMQLFGSAGKAL